MYVYKITNKINGKFYIGKTVNPLYVRFSQHKHLALKKKENIYFYNAIRKYGIESFQIELIETLDNNDKLTLRERYWIKKLNPDYNLSEGGEGNLGYRFTDEQRKYLSNAKKGKKLSEQHIDSLRKANLAEKNPMYGRCGELNPFYGKKHSNEFINKQSKEYAFINPLGNKIYIKNLAKYCRENELHCGNMNSLFYGKIN